MRCTTTPASTVGPSILFATLLSLVALCNGDVWVSPGAAGNGSSAGSPLGNLGLAVGAVNAAGSPSSTIIWLMPGTYSGNENVNLALTVPMEFRSWGSTAETVVNTIALESPFMTLLAGPNNPTATIRNITFMNYKEYEQSTFMLETGTKIYFHNCVIKHSSSKVLGTPRGMVYSDGGRVEFHNSHVEDLMGTLISAISSQIIMLGNRFFGCVFPENGGPTYGSIVHAGTAVSSILILQNNVFSSNVLPIYLTTGLIENTNNKYYTAEYTGIKELNKKVMVCSGTVGIIANSGNLYCGPGGNDQSCGFSVPELSAHDGCGICGGNNEDKDCNGVCRGTATVCAPHNEVWFSATAVVPSGDGSNASSPLLYSSAAFQAAVNQAGYGDHIILLPGTYAVTTNIQIPNKAITVRSQHRNPELVTFTRSGAPQFRLESKSSFDLVFEGITFYAGYGSSWIHAFRSSATFNNCIFAESWANSGGAMWLENSFMVINSNQFIHNAAEANAAGLGGGALDIKSTGVGRSVVTVKSSRFFQNQAYQGGSIFLKSSTLTVQDSVFGGGFVEITGGAILSEGLTSKLTVTGSSFAANAPTSFINNVKCTTTSLLQSNNKFCPGPVRGLVDCSPWAATVVTTVNACGFCETGDSGKDCAGVCFGQSVTDGSLTCCLPEELDCNGVCNGGSSEDQNGICCLDTQKDCAGVCGGSSINDCSGICGGQSTEDGQGGCCEAQQKDCNGTCNGLSTLDGEGACCLESQKDCNGICAGTSVEDGQGGCCEAQQKDCSGICNGSAQLDCLNVCGGTAVLDCSGICNGAKVTDSNNDCCEQDQLDCANLCFGPHVLDGSSPQTCCPSSHLTCEGICNGTAQVDSFGICCLGEIDCALVCNGTSALDTQGVCCELSLHQEGLCSALVSTVQAAATASEEPEWTDDEEDITTTDDQQYDLTTEGDEVASTIQ